MGGLSGEGQGWGIKCLSAVEVGMGGQKCKGDKVVWARRMYVACVGGGEEGGAGGLVGAKCDKWDKVHRMQGGGACVCSVMC